MSQSGTSVLIVEDHRLVREGLRRTLEDAGFTVVGEAADGDEALTLAEQLRPDVALMDVSMPVLDGIAATRRLRTRAPDTRVVVLTMHADQALVEEARSAGAVGYVVKDVSSQEVAAAVQRAADGADFVEPAYWDGDEDGELADDGALDDDVPALTPRETQILQMLADGCSPAEVADGLTISPKTVRNHLSKAYRRLDVSSRSQAIVTALRHELIELPAE